MLPAAIMEVATVAIDESVIVMLSASATSQDSVTISPGMTPVVLEAAKLLIVGGESSVITTCSMTAPAALVAVRV